MTRPLSSTPARLQGDRTTASLGLAVRERRHIFVNPAPMNMWLLCSAVVSCGGVSPSGMTVQWRLIDCTLTVLTEASVTSSHKRMKDPALVLPPRVTTSAVLNGRSSAQRYPPFVWSGRERHAPHGRELETLDHESGCVRRFVHHGASPRS